MDDLRARVQADIEAYGWHVVKVAGDDELPGWAYTIGLHGGWGHPELAVFGLELDPMHELLNHLGALVLSGQRFAAGHAYAGIFEGLACAMRAVAPRWVDVFFGNAAWHYERPDVELLQCFWPDPEGRFPWDEDFEAGLRDAQPLLYEAAPARALSARWREVLAREGALDAAGA